MERVDSVVTGEAEGIWSQVLEDARNGSLKRRYDGGLAEISDVPSARHDLLATAIRILREYERGVIFRLGRVIKTKGPGFIILIPIIDKMVKVSLRLVTMDVPPQDVIHEIMSL